MRSPLGVSLTFESRETASACVCCGETIVSIQLNATRSACAVDVVYNGPHLIMEDIVDIQNNEISKKQRDQDSSSIQVKPNIYYLNAFITGRR